MKAICDFFTLSNSSVWHTLFALLKLQFLCLSATISKSWVCIQFHTMKLKKLNVKKNPKLNLNKGELSSGFVSSCFECTFCRNEISSISVLKAFYQMFCISAELNRRGPDSVLGWWTCLHWPNQKCAFICVVDQTPLLKDLWVFIALLSTAFF